MPDDASQLARPKSQRRGISVRPRPMARGWHTTTDLSRDPRAIAGRHGGLLRGACPHALTSTSGVAGEQVEVSHVQYSWRWLVSAKPSQIGAIHVFHLIRNGRT